MKGDSVINDIIENLLFILPFIHRKILKIEIERENGNLSRPHLGIMMVLHEEGTQPISEIGKRLLIPKPQMTGFLDKLESMGMVERFPDSDDRRVINIKLTEKGQKSLDAMRKVVRENLREIISGLDAGDLEQLSSSLANVRNIMTKL
ncbi:MAG: MarR family transcriptional regulator [Chloroflexota bacterium]